MGFEDATPIQQQAIPIILSGDDLIACAQTGTGKTAAFVLPILSLLSSQKQNNKVKALIIAPTRELAKQIDMQIEGFSYFTNSSSYPIYGGGTGPEFENQKQALVKGTDIIICTPGRLMAHLKFDYFDTDQIDYLILDEADRMLDMGFYDDIIKIAKKIPESRLYSSFSHASYILINMDDQQTNHLKAYGIAFLSIENEINVENKLRFLELFQG